MKVLYADDNVEIRDYVSMILEAGLDCEMLEASSGNEALAILEMEEGQIDFLISEVKMKGGNGNVIIEYLDDNKIFIPIVWLSDPKNRDAMIVHETLGRGDYNDFVPKPFKDDQFFPVIDRILKNRANMPSNTGSVSGKVDGAEFSNEEKPSSVDADWSLKKEKGEEGVADWSLKKEHQGGEGVADWSLKKEHQGSEGEADWSLKNDSDSSEGEADWSLKNDSDSSEGEADWSLKNDSDSSEGEADWSLKAEGGEGQEGSFKTEKDYQDDWEVIRKENQEKSKKSGKKSSEDDNEECDEEYDMERFKRIKIKRFYNFTEVCCDVYIRLSKVKYVKVINLKETYDFSLLEKYEERLVKYLYIPKEDYMRFSEMFGHKVLDLLEKAQNMSVDAAMLAELGAFDHTLKFAKEFGVTENTANKVRKSVESNLKTLKKVPGIEEIMARILRGGDFISEHSLFLSYVAGQICMATSWGNHNTLEKLSMAAMFHDVAFEDEYLCEVHDLKPQK